MAGNVFLKLGDDIKGESADTDHLDEIEVVSWSWGASNSGTMHLGKGRGEGKASISDITVIKRADVATAPLWLHICQGKVIPEGVLTVRGTSEAGGAPVDVLVITMTDVLITSLSLGSAGEGDMDETLSLNFREMEVQYTSPDGDTSGMKYVIPEGPASASTA